MASRAALTQGLDTPLGHYPAGVQVLILDTTAGRVKVCLDPEQHLGRCHTATIPSGWLTGKRGGT